MKTVAEHLAECLELATPLPPFEAVLQDAVGCILADDVRATVNVPFADLAACDGYAVLSSETNGARPRHPVDLRVIDEVFASSFDTPPHVEGSAVRIASGSKMPGGADAVVPLTSTNQGVAEVEIRHEVGAGANVRGFAQDMGAGDIVATKGTRVSARTIAVVAAAGRDRVLVRPAPRVVVMSIGDELVEPGQPLSPGKTYDANSHALTAAAKNAGATVYRVPAVSDHKQELRDAIEDQLVRADVIITTGGLSYGGGDTVKEVLSPLGSVRFDNVAMTPGRQIGLGTVGDGAIIFCLPGEPVAALIAFEVFVRPALRNMAGYASVESRTILARASRVMESSAEEREFVRVRVHGDPNAGYACDPVADGGQPLLTGLGGANGLAIIPEGAAVVAEGERLECIIFNG